MKSSTETFRRFKQLVPKILLSCLFVLAVLQAQAQQPLAVIGNQKGPPPSISFNELRSVFMGEKQRWNNGTKVIIALMKTNNELGLATCNKVYDMRPDELNKYWLALVFQGKASAPYFFNSVSELQSFVSQNPGAIGIINEDVSSPDIKTLVVDGRKTF